MKKLQLLLKVRSKCPNLRKAYNLPLKDELCVENSNSYVPDIQGSVSQSMRRGPRLRGGKFTQRQAKLYNDHKS